MTTEDQEIHLAFKAPMELPIGKCSFAFQSGALRRGQLWKVTFASHHQQVYGNMKLTMRANVAAHSKHGKWKRCRSKPGDILMEGKSKRRGDRRVDWEWKEMDQGVNNCKSLKEHSRANSFLTWQSWLIACYASPHKTKQSASREAVPASEKSLTLALSPSLSLHSCFPVMALTNQVEAFASIALFSRTGVPDLRAVDQYLLSDQQWHYFRNKVHNKCNALESSWNHSLPLYPWKNCLPGAKRLGTAILVNPD